MILEKEGMTTRAYADLAVYANANGLIIEDKGDYLETVEIVIDFNTLKSNKLTEINSAYTTEAEKIRINVPEDEIKTWDIQKLEAQAWELDSTVETPFCTGLAEAREMDREVLLNKVLTKVYNYQTVMAGLTGKRQKLEDQLDAITEDTEENRAIIEAMTWE